jgi:hypothetical protein
MDRRRIVHRIIICFFNVEAGVAQWLERQPSKLRVAGSNPVSRSINLKKAQGLSAHVAQSVEHILGKDEVTSSILVVGSIVLKEDDHEKYYHVGLHGMQAEKLFDDKEQADHAESIGIEKILQILPVP